MRVYLRSTDPHLTFHEDDPFSFCRRLYSFLYPHETHRHPAPGLWFSHGLRNHYQNFHANNHTHCIHRLTDMAYCSTSWELTSLSQPRSFSHFHVSSYTSAAQRSLPFFCLAFRYSLMDGTSAPSNAGGSACNFL